MNTRSQATIKKWFDQTYKQRGFFYLRPIEAYELFATILDVKNGDKHLDVACGLGLLLKCFTSKGVETFGIDLSTEGVQIAKKYCPEASIDVGNAESLPFPDSMFDSLTCIGSLERILDREKALSEQFRVLKPQGRVCIMVRNAENFTWRFIQKPLGLRNKKGHQDALNLSQWKSLLQSSGFEIESVFPDHWPYFRLLKTLIPWRKPKTHKLHNFPGSIHWAYEYIFLLRKPQ